MAFRVHNASTYDDFDGDDSYNFNEAGLLVIHLGLKGRKADLFATSLNGRRGTRSRWRIPPAGVARLARVTRSLPRARLARREGSGVEARVLLGLPASRRRSLRGVASTAQHLQRTGLLAGHSHGGHMVGGEVDCCVRRPLPAGAPVAVLPSPRCDKPGTASALAGGARRQGRRGRPIALPDSSARRTARAG